MRKTMLGIGVLMAVVVGACQAEEGAAEEAVAAGEKRAALIAVGPVDADIVEKTRKWIEHSTALPVRVLDPVESTASSLSEEGEVLAAAMTPDDVCLVALVSASYEAKEHCVNLYDRNVAVVNVKILNAPDVGATNYLWRVQKLAVRSYGLLLGAGMIPIPHSALYAYADDEGLDLMSRYLDPPSLHKIQARAREAGMELLTSSPDYWAGPVPPPAP